MEKKQVAAAQVALAALLWGSDSLVHFPALVKIPSQALTFYEHLLGLLLLIPFVLRPSRRELGRLRPKHLFPLFLVGIAGETFAGYFFGLSYGSVGGVSAAFLQMLQPFFVLGLVSLLGRERANSSYLSWAMSIFLGSLVVWIFDPSFDVQIFEESRFWKGAGWGLLAVFLWAASNVAGKLLLEEFSASSLLFLRWALSLLGLGISIRMGSSFAGMSLFADQDFVLQGLAHLVLFALLPLWIFYLGLRQLPASLTTFIELFCPLALIFLPWIFGARKLHEAQWLGGLSVIIGVFLIVRLELDFLPAQKKEKNP